MLVIALFVTLVACGDDGGGSGGGGQPVETGTPPTSGLTLTSPAFDDGASIPRRYTCDGEGVSPPLRWTGVPDGTSALALIVEDPDAPRGTFTHWVVWGLDPAAGEIPEGSLPAGAGEGRNGFGGDGYGGPCPPRGSTHRYRFELLALPGEPDLAPGAGADDLRRAVEGDVLGQALLVATYGR